MYSHCHPGFPALWTERKKNTICTVLYRAGRGMERMKTHARCSFTRSATAFVCWGTSVHYSQATPSIDNPDVATAQHQCTPKRQLLQLSTCGLTSSSLSSLTLLLLCHWISANLCTTDRTATFVPSRFVRSAQLAPSSSLHCTPRSTLRA